MKKVINALFSLIINFFMEKVLRNSSIADMQISQDPKIQTHIAFYIPRNESLKSNTICNIYKT